MGFRRLERAFPRGQRQSESDNKAGSFEVSYSISILVRYSIAFLIEMLDRPPHTYV